MALSSSISDAFGAPQLTAFSPAYTRSGKHIQHGMELANRNPKFSHRAGNWQRTRRRLLVVFPIAERTTTGVSSGKLRMRSATSLIRPADDTDDPPNFITTVNPAAAGGVPPSDTTGAGAGAGAGASPFFRVVVAAAPLWQRSTRPLRAQHCPAGLAE